MSDNILHLKDGDFDKQVIEYKGVALVDFWAEWCMPCKMIGPSVAQLAETWKGKVKVGKVNVDDEGQLASNYGIISIPSLIVFKDGQPVRQKVGALPKHEIEAMFKDLA